MEIWFLIRSEVDSYSAPKIRKLETCTEDMYRAHAHVQLGRIRTFASIHRRFPLLVVHFSFVYATRLFVYALPKVHRPNAARRLSPIGSGFPDLIARGIELPARMKDATRASSTP